MPDYLGNDKLDRLVQTAEGRHNRSRMRKVYLPKDLEIAVFGWRNSGKTTLVRYLQNRPLKEPGATIGRVVEDFEIQMRGRRCKLRVARLVDHGGDDEETFYKTLVEDHPDGVIFVVHHGNRKDHEQAWGQFCEFITTRGVLKRRPRLARRNLSAVLMLMNKRDLWRVKYLGEGQPNPDYLPPGRMKEILKVTERSKDLDGLKIKVLYQECSVREERGDDVDSAMIDFLRAILERPKWTR